MMPSFASLKNLKPSQPSSIRRMRRVYAYLASLLVVGLIIFFSRGESEKVVNVYCWYQVIPPSVLEDFKKETGIRVRLDFFDNNEVVETKLLAGNSGYDVVLPTIVPYIAREMKAGALQKLDKSKIPNISEVQPFLKEQAQRFDPNLDYGIPYIWGTFGFAYNVEMIKKRLPNAPTDSYAMLFDPEIVSHFKDCGVTLLEEAVDIYPQVLNFMGRDSRSAELQDLYDAHETLFRIRPIIRRFSSSRAMTELVGGETCLAQTWSGDTQVAIREAKALGREIRYVVPKEGSALWIDELVIPKNAPNVEHAHMFINYLLKPEIAAKISEYCLLTTSVKGSKKFLSKEFLAESGFSLSADLLKKLNLDKEQELSYERERNRLLTNFRMNRRD